MELVTEATASAPIAYAPDQATVQPCAAGDGASAPSRLIEQPAFSPQFWQQWIQVGPVASNGSRARSLPQGLPQRPAAHLLAGHHRLVVVSPHPDDEILMCSGLMQAQLARGGAVEVVAVSDGEACFGQQGDRAAVGLRRRSEAAAGLRALGAYATPVHYLGVPDGAVAEHEDALARRLFALLRPGDVVVCTWKLDGHPDHDASGRAAVLACATRGARLLQAPVWMWHWARPEHPCIAWCHMVQVPLDRVQQARKAQALQCHQSQLTPSFAQPAVVDEALQARASWPFECFFAA